MKGICGICGKEKALKKCLKLGIMICDGCRKEDCCRCGRFKPVAERTKRGPICNPCFQRERYHNPTKHRRCSKCGFLKSVSTYDNKGKPLCDACRVGSKIAVCSGCNREKKIKARGFCGSCYNREQRTKKNQKRSSGTIEPYLAFQA